MPDKSSSSPPKGPEAPRNAYIERLADRLLDDLLLEHPAVLVVGPRGVGKTTMLSRRAESTLRLQRPAERNAVLADPFAALAGMPPPVLIDEWQLAPEILVAVKEAVDDGSPPGSFLITGSVRADLSPSGWPMTGRVIRLNLYGLVPRELAGATDRESFLDVAWTNPDSLGLATEPRDIRGYVEQAMRSGFPRAIDGSEPFRRRFLAGYVDQLAAHDLEPDGVGHEPLKMRRYLQTLAANTSGVVDHKSLYDAAGIGRPTAVAYDDALERLTIAERLPAWSTNRLSRLTHLPKRHLVDPALLQPLLGIDVRRVMRDADLLGRVVDSYVTAQLRADATVSASGPQLYHLRDANSRREVDVVVEYPDGTVVAIEIKAAAAPDDGSARHLRWLRDELGDRFKAGIVLHTGPKAFRKDDRIHFLPIACLG